MALSLVMPTRVSKLPVEIRSIIHRTFTFTSFRSSNIGSAPLSIPIGVDFSIVQPTIPKTSVRQLGRIQPTPTVVVKGPLGELKHSIPNFVIIEHDEPTRKALVKVQDRKERHQRAMWGES